MKIKSDNKEYVYIGFEKETAEQFKKTKPKDKTFTEYLELLLLKVL